jgi:phytol kinase
MSGFGRVDIATLFVCGPMGFLWSYFCLSFAAHLKQVHHVRTGYTRKIFHCLIFLSAVAAQAYFGFFAVCVFGSMVSLVVGYAVLRGNGHPFYEALAREHDRPNRTYYIVAPYFATLIGGLANNFVFGPLAIVGYLVGGLADAAGEPVGTRWGRHRYFVPVVGKGKATRSLEGSIGVLLVSLLALVIAVAVTPELHLNRRTLILLPLIAAICAIVEAISPHGWDNTPMQIVPALLAALLLSR